jgi:hypothetical protein
LLITLSLKGIAGVDEVLRSPGTSSEASSAIALTLSSSRAESL